MTIGEIVAAFATGEPPLRIEAYDGSAFGPENSELVLRLTSRRALQYFVTAPGDLGLARAYLMGELEVDGVHPGAPHDVPPQADPVQRAGHRLDHHEVHQLPVDELLGHQAPQRRQRLLVEPEGEAGHHRGGVFLSKDGFC